MVLKSNLLVPRPFTWQLSNGGSKYNNNEQTFKMTSAFFHRLMKEHISARMVLRKSFAEGNGKGI